MNFKRGQPPGLLGKLAAATLGGLVLAGAFAFSLLVFFVFLLGGVMLWAYLWWKTRPLRRQMRTSGRMPPAGPSSGPVAGAEVIEGQARRVVDEKEHF